jgi:hypothetical protein
MKFLFSIALLVVFAFTGLSQNNEQMFVEDVKVRVEQGDGTHVKNASVKFVISGKKSYRASYIAEKEIYIFDKLPMEEGTLHVKLSGYDSQERKMTPMRKERYKVYLGKTGSVYTFRDGAPFPYHDEEHSIGLKYEHGEKDSVITYLESEGFKILPYLYSTRGLMVQLKSGGKVSPQHIIDLNSHGGIRCAGRLYSQPRPLGFFMRQITLTFRSGVTMEQKKELLAKYKLTDTGLNMGNIYFVTLSDQTTEFVNTVVFQLVKESSVLHAYSGIKYFANVKDD